MSEWQKNVENRAKHITAMYILEDGNAAAGAVRDAVRAQRSAAHRKHASDMAFGLFCIMMGLTMCILSAGLFIAAENNFTGSASFTAAYMIFGLSLLVRGIIGLI